MRRLSPRARRHPARVVVAAFATTVLIGTALLMIPAARAGEGGADLATALFTSTSAVCVTGLAVVDHGAYWSTFGQVLIVLLVQVGGLGILTGASLVVMALGRRIGLGGALQAQHETAALNISDVRRVVAGVAILTVAVEGLVALSLLGRFLADGAAFATALGHAAFYAVMSFNQAGLVLTSEGLVPYATDAWLSLTVCLAILAGGLGVPVWLDLRERRRRWRRWSLHTKLTLTTSAALLAFGFVTVTALEWSNERTLGALSSPGALVAGFFQAVTPRNAGFNTIAYDDMHPETLLVTDMLMFVGGGSGSTGGGIKTATFAVLVLVVWAEVRGRRDVTAFGRRIPEPVQRQALALSFLAANLVVVGALVLMVLSPYGLSDTLFESISAFTTTGLSTGITPHLSTAAEAILVGLMFVGRVGPLLVGAALATRERPQLYRVPEERPIIG